MQGCRACLETLLGQGAEEDERTESQHCLRSPEILGGLRAEIYPWISPDLSMGKGMQPQKEGDFWNTVRKGLQSQS